MEIFRTTPGFCSDCGSILPLLRSTGDVACYTCKKICRAEDFGTMEIEYTIDFNVNKKENKKMEPAKDTNKPEIERKCPKCGENKMSYVTLQLRSADEGQTVFYTCTKCQFNETENS
ncbi:DNA-directed RNA polymerase I subunit RPA12 [Pseudolycoriella hygida]|uniref:DNA-directed RNA polymerase subunit n=1 Tax=Pseudolycoriella hygida TaxID=35572 RepID=A0A9Q0NAT9_9DIPT|nr:DNA-directed RNA polymerase I subunit RPA12 [Pseudolycoriella hygida]